MDASTNSGLSAVVANQRDRAGSPTTIRHPRSRSPTLPLSPKATRCLAFASDAPSAPSGKSITVSYATANGSAQAPGDYTAKSGTVTFNLRTDDQDHQRRLGRGLPRRGPTRRLPFAISDPAPADPVTIADSRAAGAHDHRRRPSRRRLAVADSGRRRRRATRLSFAVSLSAAPAASRIHGPAMRPPTPPPRRRATTPQQTGTLTFDPRPDDPRPLDGRHGRGCPRRGATSGLRLTISDPAPADPVTIADVERAARRSPTTILRRRSRSTTSAAQRGPTRCALRSASRGRAPSR